jgi:hypothetical protein
VNNFCFSTGMTVADVSLGVDADEDIFDKGGALFWAPGDRHCRDLEFSNCGFELI